MNRRPSALFAALILTLPFFAGAEVLSDVHINSNGVFTAKNITVMQLAGSTLFTRATWGTTFLRMTILTNAVTAFSKNHGELSTLSEIKVGDTLDVEGSLVVSADTISVNSTKIRDHALDTETKSLVGYVSSVNAASSTFSLVNASFGTTAVRVSADTVIKKGSKTIGLGDIVKNDKVLSANGTYDYSSGILNAEQITVYQPKEIFVSKNFEGTLKAISATSLTLTVKGTDYTVNITSKTSILNNKRAKVSLVRFAVGDTVRVYGSVGNQTPGVIVAEVVRDTSF